MVNILDLNENDNYGDWGIEETNKTKIVIFKNASKEYNVYKIPIDILVYNPTNGRMFIEAKRLENEEQINLNRLKIQNPEKYNDEVEKIIWSTNEERNLSTTRDINRFGQIEPGVVLDDGIVIDGNRRFTCLRRLNRQHPDDERFKYFLAAIIKVDGEKITKKLLKEYELRIKFGADEKVNYNILNKNMSIYWLIEKETENKFDYSTIAELLGNGTTSGEIAKICRTCKLVDEFLEYINKPDEYQIAEDMKIYSTLEYLVTYLMVAGKDLTELEQLERKHLIFDYLLTLDVYAISLNLRDYLRILMKPKN